MKNPAILILHGWGVNGDTYQETKTLLKKEGYFVSAPDLPGFGKEILKKKEMKLDDYVEFVKDFIRKNINGKYIIIAHSFGGRIATLFCKENPRNLHGLILTGAAGIKHPLSFRSKTAFFLAKHAGWVKSNFLRKLLYRFTGEFDYYKAGKLRKTFQNVIAQDLTEYLPKITVPTLIVWGENDMVVPLSDGETMRNLIFESKLIVIKNAGHKLPYEMPRIFVEAIKGFLNKL